MAPEKGKSLLAACASSINNYYEPQNLSGLVQAFDAIGKAASKANSR